MSSFVDLHTSHKWSIPNYSSSLTSSTPKIKSDKFTLIEDPRIEWCLVLQFSTVSKSKCICCQNHGYQCYKNGNYVALFLENCRAEENPVSLNISFSILDDSNQRVFIRKQKISEVLVIAQLYGFANFISHTELQTFLYNESLTILCEIENLDNPNSKDSLIKGFDSFINKEMFSDVVLFVEDEKIHAHKLILSKSPVFLKMFLADMKESNTNEAKVNIRLEVFTELLRFLYTGKVEKLNELGLEIFKAAHFYQIEDLKLMCELDLKKTLKIENCIDVLKLADDHDARYLKDHCVAFTIKNLKKVIKSAGFKYLIKSHPHLPFELLVEVGST